MTTMMSMSKEKASEADATPPIPILEFTAQNIYPEKCPFSNDIVSFTLRPSSCLHLAGSSGAGKSTLSSYIAGLLSPRRGGRLLRNTLGINIVECKWNRDIPPGERVGMLFQQTTLLDSLTVAGNVCVALEYCPSAKTKNGKEGLLTMEQKRTTVKGLLETVGLDYLRDGNKRPSELSGGMARRASLALQLAQRKHVIILDEPFAGLDYSTGVGVAKELERLRREKGTALLLISHEPQFVDIVMGKKKEKKEPTAIVDANLNNGTVSTAAGSLGNTVILDRRESDDDGGNSKRKTLRHPSFFGKDPNQRFMIKLLDYFLYSLPLILLTFLAAGLAISMLSSDILRRVDVTDTVLSVVQKEIKPLIQMFTGEETVNPMYTMMINMKVRGMLNTTIPPAKATLYAMGMAKLFVLEIGPLITSLLLSGRIGGSYAGEVATMEASAQNKLLLTLGISPVMWTFGPSILASWVAAPLLTLAGTILALEVGAHIGPMYGIGSIDSYRQEVWDAVFVPLRLRGIVSWTENEGWEHGGRSLVEYVSSFLDLRCTFSDTYTDALIEIATHPVCFHFIKSVVFMTVIMGFAEMAARWNSELSTRGVPKVITSSVVGGSLLVIFADWGFSQLLLKRH
jgi:ABC-type nitrate/sulfonate/bicarbonate transport system ATPase subunit/ABC-type transporter Mla maintaining outer membrane lipid asymmetry permease subunit MlaE